MKVVLTLEKTVNSSLSLLLKATKTLYGRHRVYYITQPTLMLV